jgi:hypothetical protein
MWRAITAVFLIACGSQGSPGGPDGAVADTGVDATADVGSSGDGATDDGGPSFGDATTKDSGGCATLNIGILGNPGANPSSNFQQWLVSAGTSVTRIQTNANDPAITANDLAPFDVVILDWLARDYSPAEATVLQNRIAAGGGLIAMSGYNGTSTDFRANVLLAPLAVAYSGGLLNGPVTSFATHPITAGLTSVTFAGGYAVSDLGGSGSTRTAIAFLSSPVAYAVQMGSGRAFVWGDEWIEFDSQWNTLPEIKQLWVNVFAWVAPQGCPLQPQ